jgi:hypothetical protein
VRTALRKPNKKSINFLKNPVASRNFMATCQWLPSRRFNTVERHGAGSSFTEERPKSGSKGMLEELSQGATFRGVSSLESHLPHPPLDIPDTKGEEGGKCDVDSEFPWGSC